MRLKCIKLAGFKSFVDATTVIFPSNMCGVVGPNGCGKSNIIDAVRWVMGESSAKNLRGESMTDVIFKGSKARKVAGFAQVELIFDNHEGRITGEYAAYQEISIKRRLTSDAQNTYFLNGTKCRRRDIMDIFLGTGLGPRSYSIISQGMISNLIESKPEELRTFIEEAAGISKYKERRRETENRIRRTTENLDRLNDLREELDKRLSHLKHQAETAEKYKNYKEEERKKRAELHGLRWRELNKKLQAHESTVRDYEIKQEAAIAKQVANDSQIEQVRIKHQETNDTFQETQSRYYKIGNDITRIEQTIAHQQEKQKQLSVDLQESEILRNDNASQIQIDESELKTIKKQMESILPNFEVANLEEKESHKNVLAAEETMDNWQQKKEQFSAKTNNNRRNAEVAQSEVQHTEQGLRRLNDQINREQEELNLLSNSAQDERIEELQIALIAQQDQCKALTEKNESTEKIATQIKAKSKQLTEQSQLIHQQLSEAKGKKVSLTALQNAALNQGESSEQWLLSQNLNQASRLAEKIQVKKGWEVAVETVLGDFLQSLHVNNIDDILNAFDENPEVTLSFVSLDKEESTHEKTTTIKKETLAQYVTKAEGLSILKNIWVCNTLQEALAIRSKLQGNESVITPEGIWIGPDWLRVARDKNVQSGVIDRQRELTSLESEIKELEQQSEKLQLDLQKASSELQTCEQDKKENHKILAEHSQRLGEVKAELMAEKSRIEQESSRKQRLKESLQSFIEERDAEQESLSEQRMVLQEALDAMEVDIHQEERLKTEQDTLRNELDSCRQSLHEARQKTHEIALQKQSLETQHQAKIHAIERLQEAQNRLDEKVKSLKSSLSSQNDEDKQSLKEQLELLLEKKLLEEEEMNKARTALDQTQEKMAELEQLRTIADNEVQDIRTHLEALRMDGQAMRIHCNTLTEQLADDHFDLPTIVNNLPENADEQQLEQLLVKLESRIARLGAINLAAIEEYDQQSERLKYLNHQNSDLEQALDTLQQAIDRIDKETRNRFEVTFDQVNKGLQELFPRVFGGGHACLEQTGDDLLNTGISIMAQPPGKKNSTIHLLSGGEKALTAIALVFAIFRLNPSPFCMLDEVDAPLDDANVGRYINMVQEMSPQVQFIYVTHNKITMEAANQLIGVTMHEPGVSRPVSVDINAAAEMAIS